MMLPAFIRKITAKKNGRRSRRSSETSSEDDLAEVGLHLDRSRGNSEREELTSKQKQAPEPSTGKFLPEHHGEDAAVSSSDDDRLEAEDRYLI
jgi:hypothetical protein